MTAPERGLREAVEALAQRYTDAAGLLKNGHATAQGKRSVYLRCRDDLAETLATHPSPPLPGQPGVAEVTAWFHAEFSEFAGVCVHPSNSVAQCESWAQRFVAAEVARDLCGERWIETAINTTWGDDEKDRTTFASEDMNAEVTFGGISTERAHELVARLNATPALSSTTPAALSECEKRALIDIETGCHDQGTYQRALFAAVERILAARALVSEPDGLAERVDAALAAHEDRASERELTDPNAYLRRTVWTRAREVVRAALAAPVDAEVDR